MKNDSNNKTYGIKKKNIFICVETDWIEGLWVCQSSNEDTEGLEGLKLISIFGENHENFKIFVIFPLPSVTTLPLPESERTNVQKE